MPFSAVICRSDESNSDLNELDSSDEEDVCDNNEGELSLDNSFIKLLESSIVEWTDAPSAAVYHDFTGPGSHTTKVDVYRRIAGDSPVAMFSAFVDDCFLDNIVVQTNRYACQCLDDPNRNKKLDDEDWLKNTFSLAELKQYFALTILMSRVKKATVSSYWSKRRSLETPIFKKIMSRNRYHLISRFLQRRDQTGRHIYRNCNILHIWCECFQKPCQSFSLV